MNFARTLVSSSIVLLLASTFSDLVAAEFRTINPIHVPERASVETASNTDPALLQARKRLESRTVDLARAALTRLLEAWQTGGQLNDLLSEKFYDRQRFLDVRDRVSPADAKVRLLAIESIQVLARSFDPHPQKTGSWLLNSRVSIRARTQLEYSHPKGGYQKLEGVNEFVVHVAQPLLPKL
ncbi:MAG TPA: hypothetical protein PKO06_18130 [Candidatus Ozemobacteraceae bacterium]|nr:hypothetical protein [Candidatus Ozemobacteraceae bacterium]